VQGRCIRDKVFHVNIPAGLAVVDRVGAVKHHQPRPLPAREPALHLGHSIVHTDGVCSFGCLYPEQRLIKVDKVAFERLLPTRLHPKGCFLLGAVPLHAAQHQLRLPHPAKSRHDERLGACVCRIISELRPDLVVQTVARNVRLDGLERGVRKLPRMEKVKY
jgi:hypothetical protein